MKPDGEKARLRREVLSARDSMSSEERERGGAAITSRLLSLPQYASSQTIFAYCSFGSEPDTRGFLQATLESGKRLILPRVERSCGTLSLHEVRDFASDLVAGVWGIMEPDASLPEACIEDVDFVLVPGVAFDRRGGRLGYGGGYYDRLLGASSKRPTLVAAAFEVQMVAEVPVEHHDIRVDIVQTRDPSTESDS